MGSTLDGEGFIQKLWNDANSHFSEVANLAKKDTNGNIVGIWGAMSDISGSFKPWEDNFRKGLYLTGVECVDDADAPDGQNGSYQVMSILLSKTIMGYLKTSLGK